ncbi:hypothetical protein D9M72_517930 [compost metagenome]
MTDRGADEFREGHHFIVGTLRSRAGKNGDLLRRVDGIGELPDTRGVGSQCGAPEGCGQRRPAGGFQPGDIAGEGNDGDSPEPDGVLDGAVHHPRRLLCRADEFRVHRAFVEEPVRVGFLEVAAADLLTRNVRGDGQHRRARAVGVVQAVDQVQVAGAARAGADGQPAGQLGFGRGGERSCLLVPHVDPVDAALLGAARLADGVDNRVEAVAHDPVDSLHTGSLELFNELAGEFLGHECTLPRSGLMS